MRNAFDIQATVGREAVGGLVAVRQARKAKEGQKVQQMLKQKLKLKQRAQQQCSVWGFLRGMTKKTRITFQGFQTESGTRVRDPSAQRRCSSGSGRVWHQHQQRSAG